MDFRGVLLLGALTGAVALAATSACSGPDPGGVSFSERLRGSGGDLPSGSGGGVGNEAGVVVGEGGTTQVGTEAGVAPDPFFGTSVFALGSTGPGGLANAANAHNGNASGRDCLSCHRPNTMAPPWSFGGTLYRNLADTNGVSGAEIRINGPDGNEYAKTYSDENGNFWLAAQATPIPANSRVAVRNKDKTNVMSTAVGPGQGSCSQAGTCHGQGGSAGKITLE